MHIHYALVIHSNIHACMHARTRAHTHRHTRARTYISLSNYPTIYLPIHSLFIFNNNRIYYYLSVSKYIKREQVGIEGSLDGYTSTSFSKLTHYLRIKLSRREITIIFFFLMYVQICPQFGRKTNKNFLSSGCCIIDHWWPGDERRRVGW